MIRLSENIPKSEKLRRIEEIVDVLCLRKCLNTSKYTVELHMGGVLFDTASCSIVFNGFIVDGNCKINICSYS